MPIPPVGGMPWQIDFNKFLIQGASLFIAGLSSLRLFFQKFPLEDGVIKFCVGITYFLLEDKAFKSFDNTFLAHFWDCDAVCKAASFQWGGR